MIVESKSKTSVRAEEDKIHWLKNESNLSKEQNETLEWLKEGNFANSKSVAMACDGNVKEIWVYYCDLKKRLHLPV